MGVSLVLSQRSKLRSCASRCAVLKVAVQRACQLMILGLLLNFYNANDMSIARYCGVLQRLAVAHLVVSVLEITFMKKQPGFQVRFQICLLIFPLWLCKRFVSFNYQFSLCLFLQSYIRCVCQWWNFSLLPIPPSLPPPHPTQQIEKSRWRIKNYIFLLTMFDQLNYNVWNLIKLLF